MLGIGGPKWGSELVRSQHMSLKTSFSIDIGNLELFFKVIARQTVKHTKLVLVAWPRSLLGISREF